MSRGSWLCTVGLAAAILAAGCGRPAIPGRQFTGPPAITSSQTPAESPLPEKPWFEEGPSDARVRLVAFFPIDKEHEPLMNLMRGFAKQYPGKVYVRYIDYRTPEGARAYSNAQMMARGVLINSKQEFTIDAKPYPYEVDFTQDMGRYWTAEELTTVVAQEVRAAYSEGKTGGG